LASEPEEVEEGNVSQDDNDAHHNQQLNERKAALVP
jgi:hypothetical protein